MPPSVIFPSGQRTRGSVLQRNRDGSIREGVSGSTPSGQRDEEVSIEDKLYYFFLRRPLARRTRFRLCLRCSPKCTTATLYNATHLWSMLCFGVQGHRDSREAGGYRRPPWGYRYQPHGCHWNRQVDHERRIFNAEGRGAGQHFRGILSFL